MAKRVSRQTNPSPAPVNGQNNHGQHEQGQHDHGQIKQDQITQGQITHNPEPVEETIASISSAQPENLIRIRGARQHNLKNIDLELPRDRLIVFTGVSGSGKSSLAFDTIFAEGQRRYVESLSSYARQFLGQVDKPDVDAIEGLSPAISIDQKSTSHNPRSTVGTVTEIYDYLRLLFGRAGEPHCPHCQRSIAPQTIDQMVDRVLALPERTRFQILAPVVRGKKGTHQKLLSSLASEGFARVRINGEVRELADNIELDKNHSHTIEVVIDRLVKKEGMGERLADSLSTCLKRSEGIAVIAIVEQSYTNQSNTEQSNINQSNTEQSNTNQSNTEQSNINQPNAEQSNINQSNINQPKLSVLKGGVTGNASGDASGSEQPTVLKAAEKAPVYNLSDRLPTELVLSENFACPEHGAVIEELSPRLFSFNSPYGACPTCHGLGVLQQFSADRVVPDPSQPVYAAVAPWSEKDNAYYFSLLYSVGQAYGFELQTPWKKLTPKQQHILLHGSDKEILIETDSRYGKKSQQKRYYEGILPMLERQYRDSSSESFKQKLEKYLVNQPCEACQGDRLKPEALAVRIGPYRITDLTSVSIRDCLDRLQQLTGNSYFSDSSTSNSSSSNSNISNSNISNLNTSDSNTSNSNISNSNISNSNTSNSSISNSSTSNSSTSNSNTSDSNTSETSSQLSDRQLQIGALVLREIKARLQFLLDVGLDYLSLDRAAMTLSGGEAQRIRLATQIGSGLTGVLYVLDEPSIGLHQRDNDRLLRTLTRLRDLGNTLIVVEHDEDTIRAADHLVDIGPGAGVHGGAIVAQGQLSDVLNCPESLTGAYLSGRKRIETPTERRGGNGKFLMLKNAHRNNLRNLNVEIPLGKLVCITGVSGSGKSTLINELLHPALQHYLGQQTPFPKDLEALEGISAIDKVIVIDQSPIGRTPRSNPATYTGTFDPIRELFTQTIEAKTRGYKPGQFSFNVKGGRCEACKGQGVNVIEMNFLPDVYVQCEVCKGSRYNRETLQVKYRGKSIADVLDMTVEEAASFFDAIPNASGKLQTLADVGLGYVRLGQSAPTLSGGEAQRVKLATELSRRATGKTLYLIDEPTTGLSFYDVHKLLDVIQRLVDKGNSIVVIEHNLDVIRCADWIIDLGPEGGDRGGHIVVEGTPEAVAEHPTSYTGHYLKDILNRPER